MVLATSLVVGSLSVPSSGRVVCVPGFRLGNVSAWGPTQFVAAPYLGSQSGALVAWTNYSGGTVSIRIPTLVGSGNVTAFNVSPYNWTVSTSRNATEGGDGPSAPCKGPMVAQLSTPSIPGGTTSWQIASDRVSDVGLPSSLNSSQLCAVVIGAPPNCAASTYFNLSFVDAQGSVDTCGSTQPAHLSVTSQAVSLAVPFDVGGITHLIPVVPSPNNGSIAWYNYTFPAGTGIWSYQAVPGMVTADAGLVFDYSRCPS